MPTTAFSSHSYGKHLQDRRGGSSGLSLGKLDLHIGGVRSVHGQRGYRQSAVGPAVGASAERRSGLGLADHGAGLWSRVTDGQREVPQPQRLPQPGSASYSWRVSEDFSRTLFSRAAICLEKGRRPCLEAVFIADTLLLLSLCSSGVGWDVGGNPKKAKPVPQTTSVLTVTPTHQLRGLLHPRATDRTGAP